MSMPPRSTSSRQGLQDSALSEVELAALPGSHPLKVEIAAAVWQDTTVGQAWIAKRLAMGSPGNVSQQLYRHRTRTDTCKK